jgi:hypothetical protein
MKNKKVTKMNNDWTSGHFFLCEHFAISKSPLDLTDIDQFEDLVKTLNDALNLAKKRLKIDLVKQLEDYENIPVPEEIRTDSIKELQDLLEAKVEELRERSKKLNTTREWIDKNLKKIEEIEEKLVMIRISEIHVFLMCKSLI